MEKRFCPNCGVELVNPGAFCANCGCPLSAPQQMPMQQMPMMYVPARNPKKIWLIVAGVIAAVAVAVGVILAIVLSGGDSGKGKNDLPENPDIPKEICEQFGEVELVEDYRYKDILGSYSGKATVEAIGVGGDYDEIAEERDYTPSDIYLGYEGGKFNCTIRLGDDSLTVVLPHSMFGSSSDVKIDEVEFVDGIAKDSYSEGTGASPGADGQYEPMAVTHINEAVDYELVLCPGEARSSEYRICGTIQIEREIKLACGLKCSYEIELTVDCEK